MKEYRVLADTSMAGANKPEVLQQKINEEVKQGWAFTGVTSFATTTVSKVYLFFEREMPNP